MGRFLVGKTSEIKVGQMKKISIDEKDVVIANFDGNFFAVDDTCTHAGASPVSYTHLTLPTICSV